MQQWTGCVAGALTREEFEQQLTDAGLTDIEVREAHRVHEHATSAIVLASRGRLSASFSGDVCRSPVVELARCPVADNAAIRRRARRMSATRGWVAGLHALRLSEPE